MFPFPCVSTSTLSTVLYTAHCTSVAQNFPSFFRAVGESHPNVRTNTNAKMALNVVGLPVLPHALPGIAAATLQAGACFANFGVIFY